MQNLTENDIQKARFELARKYCKDKLDKYDVEIPELVKYCKYNGSYDDQIREALKNNDIESFNELINYRNDMIKYDEMREYLNDQFNSIMKDISNDKIINYLLKNSIEMKNN
tara:strand:- start:752 stop:1087 length:336 start_codon:yes stop_codon:yes gene_type:complete